MDYNSPAYFERFIQETGVPKHVVKIENTGFTITEQFSDLVILIRAFLDWLKQKIAQITDELKRLEGTPSNTGKGKYISRRNPNLETNAVTLKQLAQLELNELLKRRDDLIHDINMFREHPNDYMLGLSAMRAIDEMKDVQNQIKANMYAWRKMAVNPGAAVEDWEDVRIKKPKRKWYKLFYGSGKTAFENKLATLMFSPEEYMKVIRMKAKQHGYEPDSISFSDDSTHKLQIKTPDGKTVKFGRVGYGDHLIWSFLESKEEAPKGIAKKKQDVFHASHSKIKGNWRKNKYSPNNLALNLLW